MSIGAVILAAGKSSRMGTPKWKLELPNGEFIANHLYNQFTIFGCDTVIVLNDMDYELASVDKHFCGVKFVKNSRLDLGRLYSLQCGLKNLSSNNPCFVHNIDNPFVSNDLLTKLKSGLAGFAYALPEFEGQGGHPLLIGSSIVEHILQFKETIPDLKQVLCEFEGNRVKIDNPKILININTPEDYEMFISGYF